MYVIKSLKLFLLCFVSIIFSGCIGNNNQPYASNSTLLIEQQLDNAKNKSQYTKCPETQSLPFSKDSELDNKSTVFGMQLGKPLKIQECKKSRGYLGSNDLEYTIGTENKICFKHAKAEETACAPINNESIQICYPSGSVVPRMLEMGNNTDTTTVMTCMSAIIQNGNLEGVQFNTRGIEAQDIVLDGLVNKYGKPIKVINKVVQNGFGAKFDALSASWELNNLFITFSSVLTKLDKGSVIIDTAIGKDARHKMFEEKWKDKIPL